MLYILNYYLHLFYSSNTFLFNYVHMQCPPQICHQSSKIHSIFSIHLYMASLSVLLKWYYTKNSAFFSSSHQHSFLNFHPENLLFSFHKGHCSSSVPLLTTITPHNSTEFFSSSCFIPLSE